jgi:hypothetical protein
MDIALTLTLSPADVAFLDAFLLAEGSGETREALVARLAFKSLFGHLEVLRAHAHDRVASAMVTSFTAADEATQTQALAVLGLTMTNGVIDVPDPDPTPAPTPPVR